MALAYTAPTWADGSGTGISASQLQAISNCIEGLVQGSDKAIHSISLNNSTITVIYADGTQETAAADVRGIISVTKVSSVDLVDTYVIQYSDGTSDTFTITNGVPGTDNNAYHVGDDTEADLSDDDAFPFYDNSASGKRKSTWANIKAKLNTVYAAITVTTSTRFQVSTSGWTEDSSSQSGVTLYKKSVSLSHVYKSVPDVSIGALSGLPTAAEQTAYDLLKYVTVDDAVPCLYLYASAAPSDSFYINVEGVD